MDEANGRLPRREAGGKPQGARLRVAVSFAYCLWCQKRVKELVDSLPSFDSPSAWLASFSRLRRAARNAEFRWVAAIYDFKRLVETIEDPSRKEN